MLCVCVCVRVRARVCVRLPVCLCVCLGLDLYGGYLVYRTRCLCGELRGVLRSGTRRALSGFVKLRLKGAASLIGNLQRCQLPRGLSCHLRL